MENYLLSSEKVKITLQSEYNVIGCILVDTDKAIKAVRSMITPEDFYDDTCRALYTSALDLLASGQPVDPVLIQNRAAEMGFEVNVDTAREIQQCFSTTANIISHASKILEASQSRKAVAVGNDLAEEKLSVLDAVGKLQEILNRHKHTAGLPLEMANELTDYLFKEDAAPPFLSTGYSILDKILGGGFIHGGLYTFAARTNVGKSNVAINISQRVADRGKSVLYFTLEMPRMDINVRRLAVISGMSASDIKSKRFLGNDANEQHLMRAMGTIGDEKKPFMVYDLPATLDDIEREVRSHEHLDLIVIDHIGIIAEPEGSRLSQYQFMTGISHRLKRIALSTRVPILALCQLNREAEKRQDKEPMLSDLRDSGSIEEDSDAVILLYRESLYLPEDMRPKGTQPDNMNFFIKKNRHGPLGTAIMKFYGCNSRIIEEVPFR